MKAKMLIAKLNFACLTGDKKAEKDIWWKLLLKSLKHKKTFPVS
jgi:hypothetical protein